MLNAARPLPDPLPPLGPRSPLPPPPPAPAPALLAGGRLLRVVLPGGGGERDDLVLRRLGWVRCCPSAGRGVRGGQEGCQEGGRGGRACCRQPSSPPALPPPCCLHRHAAPSPLTPPPCPCASRAPTSPPSRPPPRPPIHPPAHPGCYILRPYSFAIWDEIKNWFDARIKEMGVQVRRAAGWWWCSGAMVR